MAAPKGTRPPAAGMGRKPGVPNKVTADVKAMILQALSDAGGADYLRARSQDEPAAFMQLVGKVLPLQVTGADGTPLIPPDNRPPIAELIAASRGKQDAG